MEGSTVAHVVECCRGNGNLLACLITGAVVLLQQKERLKIPLETISEKLAEAFKVFAALVKPAADIT